MICLLFSAALKYIQKEIAKLPKVSQKVCVVPVVIIKQMLCNCQSSESALTLIDLQCINFLSKSAKCLRKEIITI